jgi:DNA-binding GntR family transcriptional regulator
MDLMSEAGRLVALDEDHPGMGMGMGRLTQLQPSSLREQARAAIRASIVTGEIEAGTIHPVSYFATRLGVSATPIREALFDLVNEGLIEQIRNRGFRVSMVTDEDLDQLFELRTLLEVPSIGRVASRATPRDLEQCVEFANEIEKHAARGDLVGFLEWDRQFHSRLLSVLGNRRLVDEVQRLRDQTRLYGLRGLDPELLRSSAKEHHRILQAVRQRNPKLASQLTQRHLEHTRGIWAGRTERLAEPPHVRRQKPRRKADVAGVKRPRRG